MGYQFVEHVGEVELELEAATEAGVFAAALDAFAELVEGDGGAGIVCSQEVDLEANDSGLLLVDWLSELVFLAEVVRFVPDRVTELTVADGRLHATVEGHRDHPRHLVKAVTLNRLELEHRGDEWHGRVVLDV